MSIVGTQLRCLETTPHNTNNRFILPNQVINPVYLSDSDMVDESDVEEIHLTNDIINIQSSRSVIIEPGIINRNSLEIESSDEDIIIETEFNDDIISQNHSHISDLTIEPKILSIPISSTESSSTKGSSTDGSSTEGSSSDDESMQVMYKTIKDACKIIQKKIELSKEEKKAMEIKKKNLLLDNECIICFEKMLCHQKMILPCKHYFHEECIVNWAYAEDKPWHSCPICRKKFKFTKKYYNMKELNGLNSSKKKKIYPPLDQINSGYIVPLKSYRRRRIRSNYTYIPNRQNRQSIPNTGNSIRNRRHVSSIRNRRNNNTSLYTQRRSANTILNTHRDVYTHTNAGLGCCTIS